MKASTKTMWLIFHRWSGIIAGVLIIVVGVTGSVLIFEDELDMFANKDLFYVEPSGSHLDLDRIVARAERENAGWTAFFVSRLDDAAERSFIVTLRHDTGDEKQVFVNPYTSDVRGTRASLLSLALIRRLHGDLTLGAVGENALGVLSIILMAMFIAGLVLWWPRQGQVKAALSVKLNGGSRRVLRDLHNVSGVYLFVFLFLSALTVPPIVWKLTTPEVGPPARSAAPPSAAAGAAGAPPQNAGPPETIPWQDAADAALGAVPGSWLGFILRPLGPQPFYLIRVFPPGETAVAAQTTVFVNRFTGGIIRVSAPAAPTWTSLLSADFAASLHSGAILGLPGRLIMFIAGLFFPALFITGFILWWRRR